MSDGKVKEWKCSEYSLHLNWYWVFKVAFFRRLKYVFAAASIHGTTLLSFCGSVLTCFSKVGPCWIPSIVGNTLTTDKCPLQQIWTFPLLWYLGFIEQEDGQLVLLWTIAYHKLWPEFVGFVLCPCWWRCSCTGQCPWHWHCGWSGCWQPLWRETGLPCGA